jgi:hypothetical protein
MQELFVRSAASTKQRVFGLFSQAEYNISIISSVSLVFIFGIPHSHNSEQSMRVRRSVCVCVCARF